MMIGQQLCWHIATMLQDKCVVNKRINVCVAVINNDKRFTVHGHTASVQ